MQILRFHACTVLPHGKQLMIAKSTYKIQVHCGNCLIEVDRAFDLYGRNIFVCGERPGGWSKETYYFGSFSRTYVNADDLFLLYKR